jgi:hypothetical protein
MIDREAKLLAGRVEVDRDLVNRLRDSNQRFVGLLLME